MPPSGFNQKAVNGLLEFVHAVYEDLLSEIHEGKHEDGEKALNAEISNIRK